MMNSSPHIVIVVYNPGQRHPQSHVIKDERCTIGRAWHNDIVISDSRCPESIGTVVNQQGNLSLHDVANEHLIELLDSGKPLDNKLTNGVKIEIYLSDHPLESGVEVSWLQQCSDRVVPLSLAVIVLLLYIAFGVWDSAESKIKSFEWSPIINRQIIEALSIILLAFLLSSLIRFIKQEERFTSLLLLLSLYAIGSALIELSFSIVYFNVPSAFWALAKNFSIMLLSIITARIIIGQLSIWKLQKIWALAICIGGFFFYYNYLQYQINEDDFSNAPPIITKIYPNYTRFIDSDPVADFMKKNELLFDEINRLRDRQ